MEKIYGKDVIAFLVGRNGLVDSKMHSIRFFENDGIVSAELIFQSRNDADYESIQLTFDDVVNFGFFYSIDYIFGNVESAKLLVTEDERYYLSIDPAQEFSNSHDCDFVEARSLTAVVKGLSK